MIFYAYLRAKVHEQGEEMRGWVQMRVDRETRSPEGGACFSPLRRLLSLCDEQRVHVRGERMDTYANFLKRRKEGSCKNWILQLGFV